MFSAVVDWDYYREVTRNQSSVVIFTAPRCKSGKELAQVLQALKTSYQNDLKFIEVNVDQADSKIIAHEQVHTIPVAKFYHEGKLIETLSSNGFNILSLTYSVRSLAARQNSVVDQDLASVMLEESTSSSPED